MIKLTITTKDGSNPYLDLPDQASVDQYIQKVTRSEHWGKSGWTEVLTPEIPAIPAVPAVLDAQGNVITPEVPEVPAVPAVTLDHPAEWSYVTEDITAQIAQETAIQNALSRQSVGASIIAAIFNINDSKMAAGTLSPTQLQTMMQDSTISLIRELLWAGSLTTAKALIDAYDTTAAGAYFSASDKSQILALLATY